MPSCGLQARPTTRGRRIRSGRINESSTWTDAELLTILEEEPGIRHGLAWMSRCQHLLNQSYVIGFYHLFASVDAALAERFFTGLADGDGLVKTDPVYILRERLIRNAKTKAKNRAQRLEVWAFMIKTWNAVRRGERGRRLHWVQSGHNAEEFPVMSR